MGDKDRTFVRLSLDFVCLLADVVRACWSEANFTGADTYCCI
jgi:hypothetical protein